MTDAVSGNEAQIDYWNGAAGETWVRAQERTDAMLEPMTEIAIARANAAGGERVIDVGCGCGATTIALAESGASVWGIDISGPMLERARQRAEGLESVAFTKADAATQSLTPDHELIFSRFGVMFFSDPVAAFTNLYSGLRANGRMVFLCWQAPSENPWISIGGRALQPFLPPPESASDPREPGPFALAEADYLESVLKRAGFGKVALEDVRVDLHLGDTLDAAMQAQSEIGPVARALKELEGKQRNDALAAVRAAFELHVTSRGLDLGAAAWLVSAKA